MVTLIFPDIQNPSYPLDEKPEDAVIRSNMEDGTVKTRARFTKTRYTYELSWQAMGKDDKQTLEAFLKDTKNGALAFNWTHPQSQEVKVVRFAEMPSFSLNALHYWRVSMKLVEV